MIICNILNDFLMHHIYFRVTAWVLAAAAFGAWYAYDQKKEREFSDNEIKQWNSEILKKTGTRALAQEPK
jgi:hypothetical protein